MTQNNSQARPESDEASEPVVLQAAHWTIPQADRFFRDQPAELEGPAARWATVQQLIDFGGFLFELRPSFRPEHAMRDAVTQALLRRALVTAEGMRLLMARGLEEPAMATLRTLLDIELAMKLITSDPTDEMAHRLAARHYWEGEKHGRRLLSSAAGRDLLTREYGDLEQARAVVRSYAANLQMPVFDAVRERVKRDPHWHGYASPEAAFAAAGEPEDYLFVYGNASPFVHGMNVDHDFAGVRQEKGGAQHFSMRPFVQRDPRRIFAPLGSMATRLQTILTLYVDDRALRPHLVAAVEALDREPPTPEPGSIALDPMDGAMAAVLDAFGPMARDAVDAGRTTDEVHQR